MNDEVTEQDSGHTSFRRNLVKVLAVQVVALLLLWLLQVTYAPRSTPAVEDEVGLLERGTTSTPTIVSLNVRAAPEVSCIL